jgi:hypothetical protein
MYVGGSWLLKTQRWISKLLNLFVCLPSFAFSQTESGLPPKVEPVVSVEPAVIADPIDSHKLTSTTEARFLITTRNRGIESTPEARIEASTLMALETFRIFFETEMSPRYHSKLTINFLAQDLPSAVEDAQMIYQPNRVFSIVAGKGRILQGGYELGEEKIGIDLESLYSSRHLPFTKKHGPILELHTQANGDLTVQLTEDVTNQDVDGNGNKFPYFSNVHKQPAVIIQWLAKFGKIVPLLQLGSYDLHHSSFVTGGVEFNLAGCKLAADITIDNRGEKNEKSLNGESKLLNHHIVNKVIQASYTSVWKLIPFGKMTAFNIVQPVNQDLGRENLHGNSNLTSWDDNQSSWQLGVHALYWGSEFIPFLAVSEVSGSFYRATDNLEVTKKTEKFATIGVSGRF